MNMKNKSSGADAISKSKATGSWKKNFFRIYLGQAFSLIGSHAVQFAIIWWITVTTKSAIALTMATVVGLLPQAIIGPFAGVWIDRYSRKTIIIIADAAVALASGAMGLAFMFGQPSLIFVYIILFIRSLGGTFHTPAMQAAIPSLVPKSELTRAGGLGQMINSACNMISPMIGALLMNIMPIGSIMLLDIVGAGCAILTLSTVKIPHQPQTGPKQSVMAEMKQGVGEIRRNKALVSVTIAVLLGSIVFVPLGSLLPLMVNGYFGGTAWHSGSVQTLYSLGMLTASMVVGIFRGMKKTFMIISVSLFGFGVCGFIGGSLPAWAFWIFCAAVFMMGAAGSVSNIPYIAYIQRTVPQENLGKVLSLIRSLMSLATPIGLFVAGPVAQVIGVNRWMRSAGILMMLVGVLCYFITRKYDKLEEASLPIEVGGL